VIKLYRFDYSPFVRKVQIALDLIGTDYETVDVPYGDRTELVELTGGYIQVPVLVADGEVITDSRNISRWLVERDSGRWLVPRDLAGAVWAFADWCDGPFEDVMFRIATPWIARRFARPADRALFTFIKERKYGAGCVAQWEREHAALVKKAAEAIQPTLQTLKNQPFVFGGEPTLADAALYGQFMMLKVANAEFPGRVAEAIVPWMEKLERWPRSRAQKVAPRV
jgi:glutathione S-transferase